MNVDPLQFERMVNATRTTQGQKLSKAETTPDEKPPADPKETLTQAGGEALGTYGLKSSLLGQTAEVGPEAAAAEPGVSVENLAGRSKEAMNSRGLRTEFSPQATEQVKALGGPSPIAGPGVQDLRNLAWASIDNADTKDIDQLAYAEDLGDGRIRLRVAIADVAEAIPKNTALDQTAQENTVTVYTPGKVYSMLPEELSTDWTSLAAGQDRRAIVTDMIIGADGKVESSQVYEAAVNNKAKCDYESVSQWVDHEGAEPPPAIARVPGMDEQIRLQIKAGQLLGQAAEKRGALEFEADRVMPVVENGRLVDLVEEKKNTASEAVANQMIAANTANAHFLKEKGFPVFQRVVEAPERWDRMREVAAEAASKLPDGKEMPSELAILPAQADPAALSHFLREYKHRDPEHYSEVSTSMLKLMGGGDYKVTAPGQPLKGHFGQGVLGGEDGYVHSTAPNRRLPDIIVQRLIKAAIRGEACPYTMDELQAIADQCNKQESAAKGAERQVRKMAISEYLMSQVGEEYDAVITGRSEKKGLYLKVGDPPIEGKLLPDGRSYDVGDHVRVELRSVDPDKGYIDFVPVTTGEAAAHTAATWLGA